MNRLEELKNVFKDVDENKKIIIAPLLGEIVFLETQLIELKRQPFIKIHPTNPALQRPTPASKMYKELLQQYNTSIKVLLSIFDKDDAEAESPLRQFLNTLHKEK